jgi:hypothetical protein
VRVPRRGDGREAGRSGGKRPASSQLRRRHVQRRVAVQEAGDWNVTLWEVERWQASLRSADAAAREIVTAPQRDAWDACFEARLRLGSGMAVKSYTRLAIPDCHDVPGVEQQTLQSGMSLWRTRDDQAKDKAKQAFSPGLISMFEFAGKPKGEGQLEPEKPRLTLSREALTQRLWRFWWLVVNDPWRVVGWLVLAILGVVIAGWLVALALT